MLSRLARVCASSHHQKAIPLSGVAFWLRKGNCRNAASAVVRASGAGRKLSPLPYLFLSCRDALASCASMCLFPPPKSDTPSGVAFWLRKGNCRNAASAVVRASGAGRKLSPLPYLFLSRRDALASCASMCLFPPPKSDTPIGCRFWLRKGNCRNAASAVVRASGAGRKLSPLPYLFLSCRDALASCASMCLFPPPKSDTPSGVAFWLRKGNCRNAASAVVRASGAGRKLSPLPYLFLSCRDALAPCASMCLFPPPKSDTPVGWVPLFPCGTLIAG